MEAIRTAARRRRPKKAMKHGRISRMEDKGDLD